MAQGNTPSDEDKLIFTTTSSSGTLPVAIGGGCTSSGPPAAATAGQTSKRFQKFHLYKPFGHRRRLSEKLRLHGNLGGGGTNANQPPKVVAIGAQSSSISKRGRIQSNKIKPFNASTIDEEGESCSDFGSLSVDQKDSGVDPGYQEEHVIVPISPRKKEVNFGPDKNKCSKTSSSSTHYVLEVDEDLISAGFPSDLPSGLIDIEGNFIGEFDFRFEDDYEDDDFDSFYCDDDFDSGIVAKKGEKSGKKTKNSGSKSNNSTTNKIESARDSVISPKNNNSNMAEHQGLLNNYCTSNSQSSNTNPCQGSESGPNSPEILKSPTRTFVARRRSRSPHAPLDRHYSSGATSNPTTLAQHYYPVYFRSKIILDK